MLDLANAVGIVRMFNSIRVFNCVLQQSHSERRPTGLMACAKTAAGFAVEVFVEQNEITPVRVGAVFVNFSVTRALASFIRQKDAREPARKLLRDFLECEHFSRTYWTLYFQLIAIEMVVAFERFDEQVIDRKPDRAAPVRVAAEKVAGAFAGHVIHAMFLVPRSEDVGFVAMDARDRAQSVGREKFVFIEHVAQQAHEPVVGRRSKHPVAEMRARFAVGDRRLEVFAVV